jgi:hypothetical protein
MRMIKYFRVPPWSRSAVSLFQLDTIYLVERADFADVCSWIRGLCQELLRSTELPEKLPHVGLQQVEPSEFA